MRSQSLGAWLGAAALAGVIVVYVKVDQLAADVRPWIQGRAESPRGPQGGEIPVELEVRSMQERGTAPEERMPRVETSASAAAPAAEATTTGSLEERVARLEARSVKAAERARAHWPMPRFTSTVDELAEDLGLSAAQRARVEDAVRRGSQRIEDVLRIPDETGESPWDRRQERRRKLTEAAGKGDKAALLSVGLEPLRERQTRIPGREQTYGDEIDRIREETRTEIESHLDADQKEAFRDTRIDPLLGETATVAFSVVADEPGALGLEGGVLELEETSTTDDGQEK